MSTRGFTVVELVVVIIVIGVLVGVSAVAYGNWRQETATKQLQSDLLQAAIAMSNARNFDTGYPNTIPDAFTPSDSITVTYAAGDASYFCLEAQSSDLTGVTYFYSSLDQTTPKEGACS